MLSHGQHDQGGVEHDDQRRDRPGDRRGQPAVDIRAHDGSIAGQPYQRNQVGNARVFPHPRA